MKYLGIVFIIMLVIVLFYFLFNGGTKNAVPAPVNVITKTTDISSESLDQPVVGGYNAPVVEEDKTE